MEPAEDGRGTLVDQAIDWLVRLDAGRADPAEFEAWRQADPRHAATFAQIAMLWQRTGELRGAGLLAEAATPDPIEAAPPKAWRPPLLARRQALGAMAAGTAGVLALGGYALSSRRVEAATDVGERRVLQLPRGTRATLNTASRAAWRDGSELEFWLEQGEAALSVAGALVVRITGLRGQLGPGRYNLRQRGADGVELVAFIGLAKLWLGSAAAPRLLRSGQALSMGPQGLHQTTLGSPQLDALSAWQRGDVVFDGMTLPEALAEFNRYLAKPITLADPRLERLRLGGRFAVDDPSGFLAALHEGFGIISRDSGDQITLSLPPR